MSSHEYRFRLSSCVIAALWFVFVGCDRGANSNPSNAPDPDDYPAVLTLPDAPRLTGDLKFGFFEARAPGERTYARVGFYVHEPANYEVFNFVSVPEADIARFLLGETIVLPEGDDSQQPLGYGTRLPDENGFPVRVARWRRIIAVRLESPHQGEVVVHLQLGEARDDSGVVVAEATSSASISGRADFACLPASDLEDPLFAHDPFCVNIWEQAGGLDRFSDAFAAR